MKARRQGDSCCSVCSRECEDRVRTQACGRALNLKLTPRLTLTLTLTRAHLLQVQRHGGAAHRGAPPANAGEPRQHALRRPLQRVPPQLHAGSAALDQQTATQACDHAAASSR